MKRQATALMLAILLAGCRPASVAPQAPAALAPQAPALGLPPLPAAAANDTPAIVDLGRKLFMDRRLSSNNTMSCAMCHVPEQGFTAVELGTAIGLEGRTLRRNAPTLLNVAYVGQLFHDGRSPSLENQAWAPLLNPIEMGNPASPDLIDKIRRMPDYAGKFEAAFGGTGPDRANLAAALAGYQRTLISANSRFDRWRYGKETAALSGSEQAGFKVFSGKGRCISCHAVGERHALFSDAQFHNTGIGWARSRGAQSTHQYRVQLAPGVFAEVSEQSLASVSEALQADSGRFEVTRQPADRWAYRTPSLRNVAITGPYMHDGSLTTLEQVVEYYQRGGIANPGRDPLLAPLQLSEEDKRNLVAFLRSLTGDNVDALARQARAERIDHPIPR